MAWRYPDAPPTRAPRGRRFGLRRLRRGHQEAGLRSGSLQLVQSGVHRGGAWRGRGCSAQGGALRSRPLPSALGHTPVPGHPWRPRSRPRKLLVVARGARYCLRSPVDAAVGKAGLCEGRALQTPAGRPGGCCEASDRLEERCPG
ncbi:uncharacterized protein LOC144582742 [Callithrix jacchus]